MPIFNPESTINGNTGAHHLFPASLPASPEYIFAVRYWILSWAQAVLMPLWIAGCITATGILFYNRELKKPITLLLAASENISRNQLDFKVAYEKQNELGALCAAFDRMRAALYENNRVLWRSLEERRRLNAAFSHDLRTPLTVLRGYSDFLQKYAPNGGLSEEKLLSILSKMDNQLARLELYTQKMSTIQRLEDMIPRQQPVSAKALTDALSETGGMLCVRKRLETEWQISCDMIFVDIGFVMQVYENLLSNACRYAESTIRLICGISETRLKIEVHDDGDGFREEALNKAAEPFYREGNESETHLGLGLYICRILCESHSGSLTVGNDENGGLVIAEFFCGKPSESR